MAVHPLIAARRSPRALDPAAVVTGEQLRSLLEAARWAPSFGNTQPARYLVGLRGEPGFAALLAVLTERNRAWAHAAGALLLGVVVRHNEKGEIPYAEYGLALATENLVLQAVAEGLVAHQLAGFDADAARTAFALPPGVDPLVAIAVGAPGDPASLPPKLRERELAERTRLPIGELAFRDRWGDPAFEE